ncbi:hypothetical protein GCM10009584_01890 [Ornithinimicrobium humiphilum]|uniref:Low molecular weight protein antigen 6 PH domain-containing protein n=2 Tax=Ornithinimicrobium humiphilum TaxID=125288 RepID=A0A543KRQ1_9MICO|nr:hypothetical protein FB476_2677 [Ornithinimicrobium humiphilum]
MQPAWLPRLRAGIGLAMLLVAVVVLALSWPWRTWALLVIPAWMLLGVFLVWASRFERTGTRLEPDALTVVLGRRPRRLGRADILDVRADPPEQPWRLTAVLRDGEVIPLLGVPPTELERLRRWHVGV